MAHKQKYSILPYELNRSLYDTDENEEEIEKTIKYMTQIRNSGCELREA